MIEPKAAPKFDVPTAPALRVHIEIPGFTLVETKEAKIARLGSKPNLNGDPEKRSLSGAKRT